MNRLQFISTLLGGFAAALGLKSRLKTGGNLTLAEFEPHQWIESGDFKIGDRLTLDFEDRKENFVVTGVHCNRSKIVKLS